MANTILPISNIYSVDIVLDYNISDVRIIIPAIRIATNYLCFWTTYIGASYSSYLDSELTMFNVEKNNSKAYLSIGTESGGARDLTNSICPGFKCYMRNLRMK